MFGLILDAYVGIVDDRALNARDYIDVYIYSIMYVMYNKYYIIIVNMHVAHTQRYKMQRFHFYVFVK